MTLPTIQPFDYPDWGAPGVLTANYLNIAAIVGFSEIILQLDCGYYNHTLLILDGNGDGEDYDVFIEWWTGSPSEGGSLQIQTLVTVIHEYVISIPMTNPTTFLVVRDAGATNYPHNVLGTVAQFAAYGNMVAYPGGIAVFNVSSAVPGADLLDFIPIGCGPGLHHVVLGTDATDWSCELVVQTDFSSAYTVEIANDTFTAPFTFEFIAPVTSWALRFNNNDVAACSTAILCARVPT